MLRNPLHYSKEDRINELVLDVETEVYPFIRTEFRRGTIPNIMLKAAFISLGFMLIWRGCQSMAAGSLATNFFLELSIGIVIALLTVPIHELLHAFMYYVFGAKDIRIVAKVRKLHFSVHANNYVLTGREFSLVAVVPLIVLSALALLSGVLFGYWNAVLAFLVMHMLICSGDVALISYCRRRQQTKKSIMYTYDDYIKNQVVFFESNIRI